MKPVSRSLLWAFLLAASLLVSTTATAAELNIAAASDLQFALDELASEFRSRHPETRVSITYGSSGNFYAQIRNGAPFDLFFSADIEYPRKLAAARLARDNEVFLYAVGRIVIWAPTRSPVDVKKLGIRSVLEPSVKKIAVANPRHAPYGLAAIAAMKFLKVHEQAAPRLVYGENIAQTAQFVQSGAADLGIIALSLAIAPQMRRAGHYWEIPLQAYPRMEQGGMILSSTREPAAARAFRSFILGPHGREVLKRYGFFLPAN